jgi:hypothetical protein
MSRRLPGSCRGNPGPRDTALGAEDPRQAAVPARDVRHRVGNQRCGRGWELHTHTPHSSSDDSCSRLNLFARSPDAFTAVDVDTASLAAVRSLRCFFLHMDKTTRRERE